MGEQRSNARVQYLNTVGTYATHLFSAPYENELTSRVWKNMKVKHENYGFVVV